MVHFRLLFVCFFFTDCPSIHFCHGFGNFHRGKVVRNPCFKPKIGHILGIQIIFRQKCLDPLKELPAKISAFLPAFFGNHPPISKKFKPGLGFAQYKKKRVHMYKKMFGPVTVVLYHGTEWALVTS